MRDHLPFLMTLLPGSPSEKLVESLLLIPLLLVMPVNQLRSSRRKEGKGLAYVVLQVIAWVLFVLTGCLVVFAIFISTLFAFPSWVLLSFISSSLSFNRDE